jgi:hypothetical protein
MAIVATRTQIPRTARTACPASALRSPRTRRIFRKPHTVANGNAVGFKTGISTIGREYVSLDAIHPETEPLVKTEIPDICGSRGHESPSRTGDKRAIHGGAHERRADSLALMRLRHSD